MQTFYASLPDIVIADGETESNIFHSPKDYGDAIALIIYGSGAYGETYVIEVNQNEEADGTETDWVTLQGGNPIADLAPPAAGKARIYQELVFAGSFRIVADAPVTGDETWQLNKVFSS